MATARDDTSLTSSRSGSRGRDGGKNRRAIARAAAAAVVDSDSDEEKPDELVEKLSLALWHERPRMNLPTKEISIPPGQPRKIEPPIQVKAHKAWGKVQGAVHATAHLHHKKPVVRPPLVERCMAEDEMLHSKLKLRADQNLQKWLELAGNYDTVEKNANHFLPHVGKQVYDSNPGQIEKMLLLKHRTDVFNKGVWTRRRDFSKHEHGHLPTDDQLVEQMNAEAAAEWECSSHQVEFPDTWTDPITGTVMWREERMDYLRNSKDFRTCWDSAWEAFIKQNKRSHIERLGLHVFRYQMCSYYEGICAIIDCDGDEHEAIRRLRNLQYRCEMALVAEIMGSRIFQPFFNQPRLNAAWREKLQKKDDLMERLKTPPGGLSRQLLLKMEAPEAIHTPNATAPGTMIEGEFDPPVSKSNDEYDNLATSHATAIPGIGINDAKQQRVGKENDESASASDSDSDNDSTDGGGRSRGGVSLPGLKVNTRQKTQKQSRDENEPLSPD